MSVDRAWLERVRGANRAKVGLAGLGDDAASLLRRYQSSAAPPPAGAPVAPSGTFTPTSMAAPPGTDELVAKALRAAGMIVGVAVGGLALAEVVAALRGKRATNPGRRRRRRRR